MSEQGFGHALRSTRAFLTALPANDRAVAMPDALEFQLAAMSGADVSALQRGVPRDVLAPEPYFKSWDAAHGCDRSIDPRFEAAADAIVDGDLLALRRLLAEDPGLATARSAYGHRATLLHHVAANGIEVSRQWQSPANAADVARALLAAGAEVDARCDSLRRRAARRATMTLLVSSCHPAGAGVQLAILDALIDGGADVDAGDGAPLWTAIVWGYDRAVDRLVARGARVDNLVFAACANDVERTRALLDASNLPATLLGRALDPAHALRLRADPRRVPRAAATACELLLAHGCDLTFREPIYGITARGGATYHTPRPPVGRM